MTSHAPPVFAYRRNSDQGAARPRRHPVIVVGAGPVGLTAAIDLALQGVPVVVLDEDNTVSTGSRAICWAKRSLEIFDRLGVAEAMLERGITWSKGKVFHRDRLLYAFDLLPEGGHRFPAFINLQQYLVEEILVRRAAALAAIDLRWQNRVVAVDVEPDGVKLSVATPDGIYALAGDYLIAADGVRSTVRQQLGLDFRGKVFEDRFLITDVRMQADFPTERWFWFDPPFHRGQSALLHRQADDVWRIDLQLGPHADPEIERQPERVIPRLQAMLGPDRPFEIEWLSVYTFQCRRLERFRHGRVIFIGDAAHQVSPFGARGGNSGIQDADNLVWKLALVIAGKAPERLLDSYDAERIPAADENIRHSTRTTDFLSPKTKSSIAFRDAVLATAAAHPFARALVNSGRLSRPALLAHSPLNTRDVEEFAAAMAPGGPCADAPIADASGEGWLLRHLHGGFRGLAFGDAEIDPAARAALPIPVLRIGRGALGDPQGLAAQRYDARPGSFYLIRPDQHIAGRWRRLDPPSVSRALARAYALEEPSTCRPPS